MLVFEVSSSLQGRQTQTYMSGVADRVFTFLSPQENLCLGNHPAMFLGSQLAGIGNQSLLLADFNVSSQIFKISRNC